MLKIDAHQHFWKYDPVNYGWITDDMSVIRRDFMPEDLLPLLQEQGLDGCVAVQSDQSEEDNEFLLSLVSANDFIKGIAGWVDLQSENLEERLEYYRQHEKMKGFRHVLQAEAPEFMLRPAFKKGIALLKNYGFTYDILVFPNHLKAAAELIAENPDQPFVIDHIAKPYIKSGEIEGWEKDIRAVAQYPNVCCKVSGMVTEADFHNWKKEDFTPYLDVVFDAFGTDRVLYGSDWPVCQAAGGYSRMIEIVKEYTAPLSKTEQDLFWGGNAVKFYKLS